MKKKLLITLIAVCTILFAVGIINVSAKVIDSGTCGDALTWSLDDAGTLIIDGNGIMINYDTINITTKPPWYSRRDSIVKIIINDGVTSIGNLAFFDCEGLTSITIPNSVTSIGESAFNSCSNLESITIGTGVTSIGERAFVDCSKLKRVDISDLSAWCEISFCEIGGASNPLSSAHNLYLNGALVTDLIIPDDVTSIGGAFEGCYSLTSITIPDSVTSIGNYAFSNCDGLTSITIPDSVISIGDCAFFDCEGLTSINIYSGLNSIGHYAFSDCDGLTSITIPDGVTSIGNGAFLGCDALTNINIPTSVTSLSYNTFSNCDSLESITIPNSVTNMGFYTFSNCDSLKSVIIPHGVTDIGEGTFMYCSSLDNITIPNSVSCIGKYAFQYCSNLKSIAMPYSVTSIMYGAFQYCSNLTDVYYNGSEEEYDEIYIELYNNPFTNANLHFTSSEYRVNSIAIKDMLGNQLSAIPTGTFLTTISFTNLNANDDAVIVIAQYTDAGAFKGLMYIQTEDVPTGSTIKLSIPVDNSNGDVAKLKAFCWESFGSLTPMGNSAAFPNE